MRINAVQNQCNSFYETAMTQIFSPKLQTEKEKKIIKKFKRGNVGIGKLKALKLKGNELKVKNKKNKKVNFIL